MFGASFKRARRCSHPPDAMEHSAATMAISRCGVDETSMAAALFHNAKLENAFAADDFDDEDWDDDDWDDDACFDYDDGGLVQHRGSLFFRAACGCILLSRVSPRRRCS